MRPPAQPNPTHPLHTKMPKKVEKHITSTQNMLYIVCIAWMVIVSGHNVKKK